MTHEKINPPGMYDAVQYGFSHAVGHKGARTIECAGQVAWDSQCNLVGEGDLGAQVRQVFANLAEVLNAAGASPADVVRMRTYLVDYNPDMLGVIGPAIAEFFGDVTPPANTLLGVQALALPGFLVEIEMVAVVD